MAELTYFLTEMRKSPLGGSPHASGVRNRLIKQCLALENPRDFWKGRVLEAPLVPQNVLVFARVSREGLFLGDALRSQHHRFVLITAVQGDGSVGIDTQVHMVREGQSLLIQPFQVHWYERSQRASTMRWVFVTFEHEPDERLDTLRDIGAVGFSENPAMLQGFLSAWQDAAAQDLVSIRLTEWLHALGRAAGRRRRAGAGLRLSPPGEKIVRDLNRFVFKNRQVSFSLSEVAKQMGLSSSLLRSHFRAIAGISVGKYIRELKLQYSCALLHGTRLSVSEIASRCGYQNVFSYSRAFQRTYRMAPSAYRKRRIPVPLGSENLRLSVVK